MSPSNLTSRPLRHGLTRAGVSLMTLGAILASAACSSSATSSSGSSAGKKDFTISFANATNDGATYSGMQTSLQQALKGTGAKLNVYNNNSSATTIFQNLSTMIAEKPDVIIEVNPLADASARISQQLKRSGIPCIAVNVPIDGCYFFNQDIPPLGKQLATTVAAMMKKKNWTGANTKVILLETAAYGSLNDALWQFYAPLSRKVPGMTPVDADEITTTSTTIGNNGLQVNTDYSIDAAYKTFATTLQQLPKDQHMVIDCLGDEPCIGAYRALKTAGRLDDAMLMAWGTTPQGLGLLRDDDAWVAESANFFSSWGSFLAPMALAIAGGTKAPAQTFPPQTIVTKDNVNDVFNSDGSVKQFPALAPASQYLVTDGKGILQKLGTVSGVK